MIGGSDAAPPLNSDRYIALRAEVVARPVLEPPVLEADLFSYETISIEDLIEADAVDVLEAGPIAAQSEGEVSVLTAKDIRLGRTASRYGDRAASGAVWVRRGDIAVVPGSDPAVAVCEQDQVLLGPGVRLIRILVDGIDLHFLAGVVRAALNENGHADLYRIAVPRVAPAQQRRLGLAFRQLAEMQLDLQRQRLTVEELVRAGTQGLATGRLRPAAVDE
ncbi:hypothetical protein AB0L57_18290 [Nocardia sp. NPDC052254]|uniref:hypothetical protein n=1 Tax=Nocardia sp. NPDC052254 TaxID=3155681 RepID=UPI003436E428